jgi:hypothetical protein
VSDSVEGVAFEVSTDCVGSATWSAVSDLYFTCRLCLPPQVHTSSALPAAAGGGREVHARRADPVS